MSCIAPCFCHLTLVNITALLLVYWQDLISLKISTKTYHRLKNYHLGFNMSSKCPLDLA
jgi:hypothetical protein